MIDITITNGTESAHVVHEHAGPRIDDYVQVCIAALLAIGFSQETIVAGMLAEIAQIESGGQEEI
jgi:hypothetical protein